MKYFSLLLFLGGWFAFVPVPLQGAAADTRILFIQSGNSAFSRDGGSVNAFRAYLLEKNIKTVIQTVELSRLSNSNVSSEDAALLRTMLAHGNYDLVAADGNPAADLFLTGSLSLPSGTPCLFFGYRGWDARRTPPPGITGLAMQESIVGTVDLALRLFPASRHVIILNEGSPSGLAMEQSVKERLLRRRDIRFDFLNGRDHSTRQMLSRLSEASSNAILVVSGWASSLVDPSGSEPPEESLQLQIDNLFSGPIFVTDNRLFLEHCIGGLMTLDYAHGREAAALAVRLLNGEKTENLPVTFGATIPLLHYGRIIPYHISPDRLPDNTLLMSPPQKIWITYQYPIAIAVSILLTTLFVSLIYLIHNQRKNRQRKAVFDHLPLRLTVLDADGRVYFSQFQEEEILPGQFLPDIKSLDDGQCDFICRMVRRALSSDAPFSEEYMANSLHRRARFCKLPASIFGMETVLCISLDVEELYAEREAKSGLAERFRLTLNSIGDAVLVTDDTGIVTMANPSVSLLTGQSAADMIGKDISDVLHFDEAEIADGDSVLLASASSNGGIQGEHYSILIDRQGERRHITHNASPIILADGSVGGVVMILHDITAVREREMRYLHSRDEIQLHADQERLFNACLESVILNENTDQAVEQVARLICLYFRCDSCRIFRLDHEAVSVRQRLLWRSPESPDVSDPQSDLPLPDSPLMDRLLEDHRLIIEDMDADDLPFSDPWTDALRRSSVRSLFAIPLFDAPDHRLYALLAFAFEREKHAFREEDSRLLQAAAHILEVVFARERNRAELKRSEYEKRLILDSVHIPILLFDTKQNLVRANNAALQLTEFSEKQVYLQDCNASFCHFCQRPEDCPVKLALMDGQAHHKELQLGGHDYQLTAYPVMIDEKLVYVLKTMVDVTAFNTVQRQLTRALLDAQNANKAKSFFLATMSHELRTPLNAVIGFSELLQNNDMPSRERDEYLQSINLAGNALLNLINDVLDLSKIEAEQMTLVPQITDVASIVREIYAIFLHKTREKNLLFSVNIPDKLPLFQLDGLRLRQILLNLIGNAVKFTEHGAISISLDFHASNDNSRKGDLSLTVADTGIGIKSEYLDKIFLPFVQQDAGRDTRIYKGTGLGLAISHRLAIRMGGSLTVESRPGEGSRFFLKLRNLSYSFDDPAQSDSCPEEPLPVSGGDVLLIDDVPMNLKVLEALLKKMNFSPRLAGSAAEAFSCINSKVPDYILTDVWMPDLNGSELAARIRARPDCQHIVIAAVTADTDAVRTFSARYFDTILLKPITSRHLADFFRRFGKDRS